MLTLSTLRVCRRGFESPCIKIETFTRQKNLAEIHGTLSEICGEFIVDSSMVYRWADHFNGGCVSIHNDPKDQESREHE